MPRRLYDLVGQRFGSCTVERVVSGYETVHGVQRRRNRLECLCDCGSSFTASPSRLNAGSTTSCVSCKKKLNGSLKVIDLTGHRFGKLLVQKKIASDHAGKAIWLCQCDCGNLAEVTGYRLRSKNNGTKSCGCLLAKGGSERRKKLENSQIGSLKIIQYIGNAQYECKCICGKIVIKKQQAIVEKRTVFHCGSDVCSADKNFIGPVLSRKNAKILGLKTYDNGVACSKGHYGEKLVSNMSCTICHYRRLADFKKKNPDKVREYQDKNRQQENYKENRNKILKKRRIDDPIYRYVEILRSRVGKLLRKIKHNKDYEFSRNSILEKNIEELLRLQGILLSDLNKGTYELDHIVPLSSFEWSMSETSNKLIDKFANSIENLQFLTIEDHREKTKNDALVYQWSGNKPIYRDHSSWLLEAISSGLDLPDYLQGHEDKIFTELKSALDNSSRKS